MPEIVDAIVVRSAPAGLWATPNPAAHEGNQAADQLLSPDEL